MTNTNMSTESSVVYRQTQEILGSFFCGMPLSANLSVLERFYRIKFKRSPHYQSLGVKNLKELVDKMGNMVVVFEKNKIKYVTSARVVEASLNVLKLDVHKLFNRHCGEIKFDSFEHFYKEYFYCKLYYYFYGLNNLDHLCEVLKDILEVELDPSGEKVIKPAMSTRAVETRLNDCLKPDVQKLLRHCGEVKFDSFEDVYKKCFGCKLRYYFYGLTNLDHLCEVLKDILEVGVDRSGEKVIKRVICYNLRKRKNWM